MGHLRGVSAPLSCAAMLNYDMSLWRPPSEGNNLIIQATIGCSFKLCSFCSMYRTKTLRARPLDEVFADIDAAARFWPTSKGRC